MNKLKNIYTWLYNWCDLTSRPVGWIVVVYLLATWLPYVAQKSFFSTTCTIAEWKCEYSWASAITAAEIASQLTDPTMETTVTQRPKIKTTK